MVINLKQGADDFGIEYALGCIDQAHAHVTQICVSKGMNTENVAGLVMLDELRDNYIKVIAYRDS